MKSDCVSASLQPGVAALANLFVALRFCLATVFDLALLSAGLLGTIRTATGFSVSRSRPRETEPDEYECASQFSPCPRDKHQLCKSASASFLVTAKLTVQRNECQFPEERPQAGTLGHEHLIDCRHAFAPAMSLLLIWSPDATFIADRARQSCRDIAPFHSRIPSAGWVFSENARFRHPCAKICRILNRNPFAKVNRQECFAVSDRISDRCLISWSAGIRNINSSVALRPIRY